MGLREDFTAAMKESMKAGTAARTSTMRMVLAKLKDADIAARPKGITAIPDDEVTAMREAMEEVGIDLGYHNAICVGNLPQRIVTTSWGKVP